MHSNGTIIFADFFHFVILSLDFIYILSLNFKNSPQKQNSRWWPEKYVKVLEANLSIVKIYYEEQILKFFLAIWSNIFFSYYVAFFIGIRVPTWDSQEHYKQYSEIYYQNKLIKTEMKILKINFLPLDDSNLFYYVFHLKIFWASIHRWVFGLSTMIHD